MSKTRIIEAAQNLDLETTRKVLEAKPSLLAVIIDSQPQSGCG